MLAVECIDKKIITIEGLIDSPIQKAFTEEAGFQCGFCTCGFIMNCQGLINKYPNANDEIIDEWLSSNSRKRKGNNSFTSCKKYL